MLVTFALLSLMTQFEVDLGMMKLKAFDVLIGLSAALVLLQFIRRYRTISIAPATFYLLPFFMWHVVMAYPLGITNVIREGIQAGIIIVFTILVATLLNRDNMLKYAKIIAFGVSGIVLFVILYHLAIGRISGWKEFDESKLTFSIFPMIIAFLVLKDQYYSGFWSRKASIILMLYTPLVVLSGERKAILLTLMLFAVIAMRGYIFSRPANLAIMLLGILGISLAMPSIMEIPYVKKQIESISAKDTTTLVINEDGSYDVQSLSNAQRVFALEEAGRIVHQHPLTGIGTNMYKKHIYHQYPALPSFMKVEIHSEFQRALVELGIVGLLLYLLPLLRSLFLLMRAMLHPQARLARDMGIVMFACFLLVMGTEGGGTQQFVLYALLALYPDMAAKLLPSSVSLPKSGQQELIPHAIQ